MTDLRRALTEHDYCSGLNYRVGTPLLDDPSEGVADDICGLSVANDVPEAALHEEIGNSQHGEIGSHLHGCIQTSGEDLSRCSSSSSSFADNIKKGLEIERLEEELRVERGSLNNLLLSQSGRVSLVKKLQRLKTHCCCKTAEMQLCTASPLEH